MTQCRRSPRRRASISFGGFRSIELNVVGWAALVGTGLVLGGLMVAQTDTPWIAAIPAGVVAVWIAVLALDYRRWRNLMASIGLGLSTDDMRALADALIRKGLPVTYAVVITDDGDVQTRIVFPNLAERRVRRELSL